MDLEQKLQLRPGGAIRVVAAPPGLTVVGPQGDAADPGALLVFVRSSDELATHLESILGTARADRLAWVAYPKAGALGTDLNRDRLAAMLTTAGLRPVRQVTIDDTWSALRFRPA